MIGTLLQSKRTMVLLWFFGDYIKKAKKKLEEKTVYKNINFKEQFFRTWLIKTIRF